MHLSEIAFKLYAFVYNYSSIKPQESGLIVALLGTPLLADPVDKYARMSLRKHPFKLLHKLHNRLRHVCEISTETANMVKIATPQFIKFDLLAMALRL